MTCHKGKLYIEGLDLSKNVICYYMSMSVIQDLFIGQDQVTSHEAVGRMGWDLVDPDK